MGKKDNKIYEVDLYEPVKSHLVKEDYKVRGEVNNCDLVAIKDDTLIIVELKLTLNIDLLIQATKRQRLTNFVYVAIPQPTYNRRSRKWQDLIHLLRRLELGLMIVTFAGDEPQMEIIHEPGAFDRTRSMGQSKKRRAKIFTEVEGRQEDYNIGGNHRTKLMTAYKENCIYIACCLEHYGPMSPQSLRDLGTGKQTYSILYKNYYGWFERVKRGVYQITEKGLAEFKENPDISDAFYKLILNKE